ncbi:amidohydrolase family protein [Dactylosporangium sp. CA-233914]|uniref:amidohydrolase family protein n=1 Tax=Dactylosporangium sp. CA-233914 TaxID=3239934 RepID=UPI003D9502A8
MKVVDCEFDLPPDETGNARHATMSSQIEGQKNEMRVAKRLPMREGYGFANYAHVFGSQTKERPATGVSMSDYLATARKAGVVAGVTRGLTNEQTCEIVREGEGALIGLAYIHPLDGMAGVFEFERLIRDGGLGGLAVSSVYSGLPATHSLYYPLYAKCVELKVPVRIYSAMSYANDRAYDLGHPRHIDRVAIDFPELRIVAGLGGWPWADEMAALLRRHPNLYADTSAHRPRHIGKPNSGWDRFLHYGNTINQEKIMVGLSRQLMGQPFETLIDEYGTLPLKESVLSKWLYQNAAEFYRIS